MSAAGSSAGAVLSFSFGPILSNLQFVDRKFFLFAMKRELEPFAQKIPQHGHLLVVRGLDVAGCSGNNVKTLGFDPRRSARNRSRIKTISGGDQQF